MTLLVHFLQYQLHLSEITDTKNNGLILITNPIISASLFMSTNCLYFILCGIGKDKFRFSLIQSIPYSC